MQALTTVKKKKKREIHKMLGISIYLLLKWRKTTTKNKNKNGDHSSSEL